MAIDYGDMFSKYTQQRWDNATQAFDNPEGYLDNRLQQNFGVDTNGNTKPLSTTITYNDDGTQTVTNKHEVGPTEQAAPAAMPVAQPIAQPAMAAPTAPVAPAPVVAPTPAPAAPQPVMAQPAPAPQMEQPAPAPAAPVAPEAMPQPAPATQMAAPSVGPVNPAAPVGPMPQLPQPGPAVNVAGPMQAMPEVAPAPAWQQQLTAAQGDPMKLAAFVGNPEHPEEARKVASELWQQQLTKNSEEGKANKLLASAAQGDPKATNDLARHLRSRSDEGSYLKAILFNRLGLTDLAKEEQAKLSSGGLESTMLNGSHYTVERNRAGGITRAWDTEGNLVGDKDIAKLNAEALTTKGIETGKTLYKTPDGSVYAFSTMPGRPGGIWTNMTSGAVSQTAPKGVTPFGQQDPTVVRGLQIKAAAEKQARLDNQRAGGTRFTEDQIAQLGNEAFKSFTGYNFSPRIAEAASEAASTGYVAAPEGPRPEVGAVERGAANQAGAALSPALQSKVISAQRNWDEQNALYQQSVANGTPGKLPNGNPVAKPGTSAHEGSGALDIPAAKLTRDDRVELAQAGYYQPLANDPNHWERLPSGGTRSNPNDTVKSQIDSQAQAIADYSSKPLSAGGSQGAYNQAVMARVRELNPSYDDTKYAAAKKTREAFATGKQGDAVRSMNVASGHLDTLAEQASKLNNSNVIFANKAINEIGRQFGQPEVTTFDGLKSLVGSEIAKAIQGGATALGDREEARHAINSANSPKQLAEMIKSYQHLMGQQLTGLKTQYESVGLRDFDRMLSPRTNQMLNGESAAAPLSPAQKAAAELERRRKGAQ
jgi:hypothetical protein